MQESPLASPLQIKSVALAMRAMIAVVVIHGALAVATFFRLPASIPLHFDATGAPDAYGPATVGNWFGLVLVSAICAAVLIAVALSTFRIPLKYLSVPRKREFLALPQARRNRLLGLVSAHTLVLGATMCAVFLAIQLAIALAAHGAVEGFPAWIVFLALALMIVEIVIMIASFSRGVDKEISESVSSTAER